MDWARGRRCRCTEMLAKTPDTHLGIGPVALPDVSVVLLDVLEDLLNDGNLLLLLPVLETVVAGRSGVLLGHVESLLYPVNVLEPELGGDDLHVTEGVDVALNVDDLSVVESTNDLEDTVDGSHVGQESVSETGTGGSTGGKTSDVNAREEGGDLALGLVQIAEPEEAVVRDGDTRLFWLDSGVREVGSLSEIALGDHVEEGRLADVGKTNDTHLEIVRGSAKLDLLNGGGLLGRHPGIALC